MAEKVLVVDDDPAISEMLTIVLQGEGFDTVVVGDGPQAVEAAENEHPDLILLDLMLPGMSGIDVCRAVREFSAVPIVMLTAKTDTVDVVLGLETGADDYVPELLTTLASRPRQVFAREELLERGGGYRKSNDTRLVNVHIQRLRSKVEKDPDNPTIIQTVRGVGYKTGE
ncbi:MAG: response regulator transcription factor [Corynebacterium sp.]|nr:response regulator transcription factor [Corynebacterium sp.]